MEIIPKTHALFFNRQEAEEYKRDIQTTLDLRKGGYSGKPWIQVCVFPIFDGRFAVPLPIENIADLLKTDIGIIVEELPIQPKEPIQSLPIEIGE